MSNAANEILERKLRSLFPEQAEDVVRLLLQYGREENDREPARVRLAIVKLSGGNYDKVQEYIHAAKVDYRDVLAWAEYPEELGSRSWELSTEETGKIRGRDLDQYKQWLDE